MPLFYQPGRYLGCVTNHVLGRTKTGKPQFILTFEVLERIAGEGSEPVAAKYERSVFRVITDKTVDYIMEDLDHLGFTHEKFGDLDVEKSGAWDIRGDEFEFSCTHESYEGKQHEKWQLARDGGGLQHTPLEVKEVRQLDALFGKALRKRSATTPSTAKTPYSEPVPPARKPVQEVAADPEALNAEIGASSDDVPF